ncbi:(2Fe-2S)-binding protein [Arcobacter arenosus]|uniref:(2Fe-2S)-binding protein n=1 Tax=Arcobacter arenosus TaxID=2576037 RepID=A0A5R8XYR7_9BACT|nr:(2Fe-2S)-binding protein [Arcobacter arenosus]TLP36258.1 (2Fe-2S)-binding protein [Arcobacter arenosus]
MLEKFDEKYEVCNCRKVSLETIKNAILKKDAKTLGDIQDITTAGTDCRHCIFPEGDFGKIKKKIYCKDILKEVLHG